MTPDTLRKTLAKLRTELGKAQSVDDDSRRLLQDIIRDTEKLPATPDTKSSARPASQRLEALAVQFEAAHPTLGAALRELVELLAQAGI